MPDLARHAKVSRQAVFDLADRGRLNTVQHVGRRLVPELAALAYLEQRRPRADRVPAAPVAPKARRRTPGHAPGKPKSRGRKTAGRRKST